MFPLWRISFLFLLKCESPLEQHCQHLQFCLSWWREGDAGVGEACFLLFCNLQEPLTHVTLYTRGAEQVRLFSSHPNHTTSPEDPGLCSPDPVLLPSNLRGLYRCSVDCCTPNCYRSLKTLRKMIRASDKTF